MLDSLGDNIILTMCLELWPPTEYSPRSRWVSDLKEVNLGIKMKLPPLFISFNKWQLYALWSVLFKALSGQIELRAQGTRRQSL